MHVSVFTERTGSGEIPCLIPWCLEKSPQRSIIGDLPDLEYPEPSVIEEAVLEERHRINNLVHQGSGENIYQVRDALKKTMMDNFGVYRDGPSMEAGLIEILSLRDRCHQAGVPLMQTPYNLPLVHFLEITGMVRIAETVARCAIARNESRGSHARRDYPVRDDDHFLSSFSCGFRSGGCHHRPDQSCQPRYVPCEGACILMKFRVFRYSPGDTDPHYDLFPVVEVPGMTVLAALTTIQEQQDPGLSFRSSCRGAVCGSCAMLINKVPRLACRTQVNGLADEKKPRSILHPIQPLK